MNIGFREKELKRMDGFGGNVTFKNLSKPFSGNKHRNSTDGCLKQNLTFEENENNPDLVSVAARQTDQVSSFGQ